MESILYYRKNKNSDLFKNLEDSTLGVYDIQNYIPLYNTLFNIDSTNYNLLNLNNKLKLKTISNELKPRLYECYLENENDEKQPSKVFFKCSPLIDPVKYMVGKYEDANDKLKLPSTLEVDTHEKIQDVNNSAYIDGFFSFLSSQILHKHNMVNSLDYFGAYVCYQSEFKYDIYDDLEYIYDSDYFSKNKNHKFVVDEDKIESLLMNSSKDGTQNCNRPKLKISKNVDKLQVSEINDSEFEDIFESSATSLNDHESVDEIFTKNKSVSNSSNSSSRSSYSSRTSNTSGTDSDEESESDDEYDSDSNSSETSMISSDEEIFATIYNFPTEIIALEACSNTLNHLLTQSKSDSPTTAEWRSILMQIVMNLLMFQKAFNFTHNDLHTNNVMYIETEREFLYYKIDNKYYKVPTFGKIFKIIDFGRSIYKFNGNTFCSDSYHPVYGDAATQYNCEPYFNEKRPRLDPHYGFDLCRLGCALYDDLSDMVSDDNDPVYKLITEWITDDNGKNILYKSNGKERYPDFKLYIMIARNVHNPTPKNQLKKEFFAVYETTRKKINKKTKIIDIDELPCYA